MMTSAPKSYLIVERNHVDQVWRAIVVNTDSTGAVFIASIVEADEISVAVGFVQESVAAMTYEQPTHIRVPNAGFDDGGALTLAEVAEAVFAGV